MCDSGQHRLARAVCALDDFVLKRTNFHLPYANAQNLDHAKPILPGKKAQRRFRNTVACVSNRKKGI
jgi:hypothetical protein